MSQSTSHMLNTIRSLTAQIQREKRAMEGLGETDHPVMDADNGEQEASEGSRAAENDKDVKDSVPANIGGAPDPSPTDSGTDRLPNIGLTQSATGEAPEIEDDYKGHLDDPGTESVATVEDGVKYGEWEFDKLRKHAADLGNRILADVTLEGRRRSRSESGGSGEEKAAASPNAKAAAAGYADAALAERNQQLDECARQLLYNTVKEGRFSADLTAEFLHGELARIKRANDEEALLAELMAQEGGGGAPPEGGDPEDDPGIPVEGGGDVAPLDPADAGGDPEADAGINGAVDDLGLPPEVLAEIIQLLEAQEQGREVEDAPPAIADMPPKTAGQIKRAAVSAVVRRRNGGYEAGPAKTARERTVRAQMRAFLSEVVGRVD